MPRYQRLHQSRSRSVVGVLGAAILLLLAGGAGGLAYVGRGDLRVTGRGAHPAPSTTTATTRVGGSGSGRGAVAGSSAGSGSSTGSASSAGSGSGASSGSSAGSGSGASSGSSAGSPTSAGAGGNADSGGSAGAGGNAGAGGSSGGAGSSGAGPSPLCQTLVGLSPTLTSVAGGDVAIDLGSIAGTLNDLAAEASASLRPAADALVRLAEQPSSSTAQANAQAAARTLQAAVGSCLGSS